MSRRNMIYCLALFLALTSVSAIQRLHSINDLKKIKFGHSVPKHSLLLLHWFANTIDVDNNDVMWLTFEPNRGDYGSHHYGNFEELLPPRPANGRYYTVGNIYQATSMPLPSYVTQPLHNLIGIEVRNRARIIFRVRENTHSTERQAWQRIDQVYITQHYGASENQGSGYDPTYTYQITINLLREIREFSVEENQRNSLSELRDHFGSYIYDSQLRHLRKKWGDLACLGLLLFIVIYERYSDQDNNRNEHGVNIPENRQDCLVVDIPETGQRLDRRNQMILEVKTGMNGNARILWSNVPEMFVNDDVLVVLFKNDTDIEPRIYKPIGNSASGNYDTSMPLNPGLQVRLHEASTRCCFWTSVGQELDRGSEFHNPTAVNIRGYDARLQLTVKNGKACARLYVIKSFSNWRSEFKKSWVGFYSSANKATEEYDWWQWQWATKFSTCTDIENPSYDVYEHHSSMTIAEGVQARFILRDKETIACTPTWK